MLGDWGRRVATTAGKRLFYFGLTLLVFSFINFWRLDSLVPGMGPDEAGSTDTSTSLGSTWHNPINLPYHLLQHLFLKFNIAEVTAGRLASVFFSGLFACCLYFIIKRWFGQTAGVFGVLLFIT